MLKDLIGQQLGNYQLISVLGRGGFAEVYLGQHIRLRTQAAIKVLHTHLSPEDIEKFQHEAETIANLVHPHIVRVFDFDVSNGFPFLVMDYCPDGTLRKRHPKGERIPLSTVVSYVQQVAEALQYAHDQKIVHRDIKPENMLIGQRNALQLSDFGIAATAHRTSSMSTQAPVGTIPYMAPEQIQAQARPVSDQYALGIVVYEWLCGTRPFEGSYTEIFAKHLMTPPPPLLEKISTLPPEVEQVVLTALTKDPKGRFASVQAFATALEQACQSGGSQPLISPKKAMSTSLSEQSQASVSLLETTPSKQSHSPTTLVTPLHSFPQPTTELLPQNRASHTPEVSIASQPIPQPTSHPSRRRVIAGLVGLALVGTGSAWFTVSQLYPATRVTSTSPTATPVRPALTSFPMETLLYTYHGHTNPVWAVAWSPNGKYIASGSNDKTAQVWDAIDGKNAFIYKGHTNEVNAVAWSPDSKHIASGSKDSTVQVWNIVDGGHVFTYHRHTNEVLAVAWSPDSKRIASGSADGTVQVWDAVDGGNVAIYKGHSSTVFAVTWSPDGKYIASASYDHTVQIWDGMNSGHRTYRGHSDYITSVVWSPDGKRVASGSADKTVQVWDALDGSHVFTYRGHTDRVRAVAWSSDGKRIASGSVDKTVQIWDATDGSHVFTYRGHSSAMRAVTWSPDGKRIASGGWDNTVQVWVAP